MNRKNGPKTVAGASTAHYSTQSAHESRTSSSGFHSFLKWFKKDEQGGRCTRNTSNSKLTKNQHPNHHFNSIDEITHTPHCRSPSPKRNGLSASSSCDSIISTATTGFAFIPANQYRPNGNASQPEILIEAGPTTDTYRQRLRAHQNAIENDKKFELTLRKKYKIFDSDTAVTSSVDYIYKRQLNGITKNSYYTDLSLPQPSTSQIITNSVDDDDTIGRERKPHRRTASDSSKDKKSGAYLHVKGKRKAPNPPSFTYALQDENRDSSASNRLSTSTNSGTLSPYSTLGRKKRKAPPPPPLQTNNQIELDRCASEDDPIVLSNNGLMDDEEIKAIIHGTSVTMDKRTESKNSRIPVGSENASAIMAVRCTDSLKLEKGILRSTRDGDENVKPDTRQSSISPSSISPRPWYKRSPASNKDYAIPFKKEIVLRTMEKRKVRKSAKESPQLPEFGFSRNSSLFEGFFSRSREHERSDDQEKRRSGIGMPNISELDREAAEIVHKEQETKKLAEHEKYFDKIEESTNSRCTPDNDSNGIKFTMNNAFIQKTDRLSGVDLNGNDSGRSKINFINRIEKPLMLNADAETEGIFSNSVNKLSTKTSAVINDSNEKSSTTVTLKQSESNVLSVVKKEDESKVRGKHLVWICAYCTLENANWRVICEVCERIRPPDKQTAGLPVIIDSTKLLPSSNSPLPIIKNNEKKILDNQKQDWDNKADKVMKYFRPRISYNSLSKSASETSVDNKSSTSSKKAVSKVPLSPKMLSRQKKFALNRISDQNHDIVRLSTTIAPATNSSDRPFNSPLIESSAVVTTVTPVFYAPSSAIKCTAANDDVNVDDTSKNQIIRNIEEARLARLAKFSQDIKPHPQEKIEQLAEDAKVPSNQIDATTLEREKQRLREMIRAMNARALAEKYPPIQKSISLDGDDSNKRIITAADDTVRDDGSNKSVGTGAIKKVLNRKQHYVEDDKEISDNSNFAKNSKLDKDKMFLKLSTEQHLNKRQRPDAHFSIPTPIQELNEDGVLPCVRDNRNSDNSNCAPDDDDKPDLVKMSNDLENFKATLKNSSQQLNYTNTLALNKILKCLEVAIAEGNHELAANLAMDLAKMKITVTVTKQQQQNQQRLSDLVELPKLQNVVVDMFVEDKTNRKGPIHISIFPTINVLDLKRKILRDFRIPVERQQWILNDKLATDDKQCLIDFGMDDKSVIYLYIQDKAMSDASDEKLSNIVVSEPSKNPTNIEEIEEVGAQALPTPPIPANEIPSIGTLKVGWVCPLCTLINSPNRPGCVVCSESRPSNYIIPDEYKRKNEYEMPEELKRFLNDDLENDQKSVVKRPTENSNDLNKTNVVNRKSAEILNISITERENDDSFPPNKNAFSHKPTMNPMNRTTSIVMTAVTSSSPNITKNRYRGVDNYNPHVMKKAEIVSTTNFGVIPKPVTISKLQEPESALTSLLAISQPMLKKPNDDNDRTPKITSKHYNDLLSLDSSDVVPNSEPFECPVCFMEFRTGDGVVLRDCLHVFCRECIINTIKYGEEAEVKCPYSDAVYSCNSIVQEREIKSLVSKDIFEQHLAISLRVAENRTENAYHCKTPNCKGWCIFEDNVNEFKCPICKILNCLTCNVIHDGLNCKQYQEQMNSNCDSNAEAKRTKDMLAEMIEKGDAMKCPVCQVILMKKWGCDWLKCSMCKTEICWVTRGIRWGPEGRGDTSAGCKCGVKGVKCHPKCNYCH